MSIQVLKNLGGDAFTNLFDITIPPVAGLPGLDEIQFRVTSISIPEVPAPEQYDVHYKTSKVTKSSSKINQNNELTFNLRVDKNWEAYTFFLQWKKLGFDQYSSIVDQDLVPKVPIVVTTYDGADNLSGGIWTFEDYYPTSISEISFEQSGSDPIEVTITGLFSVMDDSKIV